MKKVFICYILMVLGFNGYSQKFDNNWISGLAKLKTNRFSGNAIGFNQAGIQSIDSLQLLISMKFGQVTISDEMGNLRFSTNGNFIVDSIQELMANSLRLNEGSPLEGSTDSYSFYSINGYQVIPDGYNKNVFYLIHTFLDSPHNGWQTYISHRILISKIDISKNGGFGEVVYKNKVLINIETNTVPKMVQHGNGKDWWLIARSLDGSHYYKALLRGDSAILIRKDYNCDPSSFLENALDSIINSNFGFDVSPSGNIIIEKLGREHRRVLSFDRCTGETALINEFNVPVESFPNRGEWEVVFFTVSPNDRYVYAWGLNGLYQWDLTVPNIANSKSKLFGPPYYIEFNDVEYEFPLEYVLPAYGPDGKLYFLSQFNHYIVHNPNERGAAANVEGPRALPRRIYFDAPNYPNYRLGPLKGSGCDTLISSNQDRYTNSTFKVYPNPSSGPITIELDLQEWSSEDVSVSIFDAIGRELYRHRFPKWAVRHEVDPGVLPPGVYLVHLEIGGAVVHTERVVVK